MLKIKWNYNKVTQIISVTLFWPSEDLQWFFNKNLKDRNEVIKISSDLFLDINISSKGNKIDKNTLINDVMNNNILITWNPWSWKTELLIELGLLIKDKSENFYPFYIPCKFLYNQSLYDYINNIKKEFHIKAKTNFIFLLDWLDELNIQEASKVINELENITNDKIIISSRNSSSNVWILLNKYQSFQKVKIDELEFIDIETYFNKWGKSITRTEYDNLEVKIKDIFLLEMFFNVYDSIDVSNWKLSLLEGYLYTLLNKNLELSSLWIEDFQHIKIFNLLKDISGKLYIERKLLFTDEEFDDIFLELDLFTELSIDNQKRLKKNILNTFFTFSINNNNKFYEFLHKTFYEFFLTLYISNEFENDKLSIRKWDILVDVDFINKLFFPYLHKKYLEELNYSKIIGLNLLYLSFNWETYLNEIDNSVLLDSLFSLNDNHFREYFYNNPLISNWIKNDYSLLNYHTIHQLIKLWKIDIANEYYDILFSKIGIDNKKIHNKESKDINWQEFDPYENFTYRDQPIVQIIINETNFIDIFNNIESNHWKYTYVKDQIFYNDDDKYKSYHYSFYENILYYANTDVINYLFSDKISYLEVYLILSISFELNNINQFFSNKHLFKKLQDYYISNHSEFLISDEITLFSDFIFWIKKEKIYSNDTFTKLTKIIENNDFYSNIGNIKKYHIVSFLNWTQLWFIDHFQDTNQISRERLYEYINILLINSYLEETTINFIDLIIKIKDVYENWPRWFYTIEKELIELLAYTFIQNVTTNHAETFNRMFDILWDEFDLYIFCKKINKIDKNIYKTIIDQETINIFINKLEWYYYSDLSTKHLFISNSYWLINKEKHQLQYFGNWLTNSYIRHWFRKDPYLSYVVSLFEVLIDKSCLTGENIYLYLDEIIDLYNTIEPISEKSVHYLDLEIIEILLKYNIEKTELYYNKYPLLKNHRCLVKIIVKKIQSNYNIEEIEKNIYNLDPNYNYKYDTIEILKAKLALYIINNNKYILRKDYYIDELNNFITNYDNKSRLSGYNYWSLDYYWTNEDYVLYIKLFNDKSNKIKEFKFAIWKAEKFNNDEKRYKQDIKAEKSLINKLDSITSNQKFDSFFIELMKTDLINHNSDIIWNKLAEIFIKYDKDYEKLFIFLDKNYFYSTYSIWWPREIRAKIYNLYYFILKNDKSWNFAIKYIFRFNIENEEDKNSWYYKNFQNFYWLANVFIRLGDNKNWEAILAESIKFWKLLIK